VAAKERTYGQTLPREKRNGRHEKRDIANYPGTKDAFSTTSINTIERATKAKKQPSGEHLLEKFGE